MSSRMGLSGQQGPSERCPLQMALGAALVNVQIPLLLGQLVEIVAKYTRDHAGSFRAESRSLSTQLLLLYGLQVPGRGVVGDSGEPPSPLPSQLSLRSWPLPRAC